MSGEKSKSQDMAEADVSAKLKMLSAKLSWVVEFPKNFEQGQVSKKYKLGHFCKCLILRYM